MRNPEELPGKIFAGKLEIRDTVSSDFMKSLASVNKVINRVKYQRIPDWRKSSRQSSKIDLQVL